MHLKFLRRGTGSARAAKQYLLGTHDHAGKERESVRVLRGDPDQVCRVAEGLDTRHKYTAAVIAWAPGDDPSAEQIDQVLDSFEVHAWSGLDADRACWCAVEHREPDSVHVHILAARCDLETGRALNIAPPGHHRHFDPWRDAWNLARGWARPDDPARQTPLAKTAGSHRERVAQAIEGWAKDGKVSDRAEIIGALDRAGWEVTRQGKDYLSVKSPNRERAVRLRGGIFAEGWTAADGVPARPGAAPPRTELETAQAERDRQAEKRAAFHRERFEPAARQRAAVLGIERPAGRAHEQQQQDRPQRRQEASHGTGHPDRRAAGADRARPGAGEAAARGPGWRGAVRRAVGAVGRAAGRWRAWRARQARRRQQERAHDLSRAAHRGRELGR